MLRPPLRGGLSQLVKNPDNGEVSDKLRGPGRIPCVRVLSLHTMYAFDGKTGLYFIPAVMMAIL